MGDSNRQTPGVFDPTREVARTQRFLPHWFQPGTITFVTFRTADSMPKQVVERQHRQLADWLARRGAEAPADAGYAELSRLAESELPPAQRSEFCRLRDRAWHGALDRCHGECLLRRPEFARIVHDALLHFNGDRYHLDSLVIMPNHVHVLLQFGPSASLSKQSDSWLRYTAREINRVLRRRGRFWQGEPFDHLVRSVEQFDYLRRYLQDNPARANLGPGEFLYWTSSAGYSRY